MFLRVWPSFRSSTAVCLLIVLAGSPALIAQTQADLQKERAKIAQFERSVEKLERQASIYDNNLAELNASLGKELAELEQWQKEYSAAKEELTTTTAELAKQNTETSAARLKHAEFQFFLVERKYNRNGEELTAIQKSIAETKAAREDALTALEKKKKGLNWLRHKARKMEEKIAGS